MPEWVLGNSGDSDQGWGDMGQAIGGRILPLGSAAEGGAVVSGSGDGVGPVIANLSPLPGELPTAATPITFDVIDLNPGLSLAMISVRYAVPLDGQVLVAYNGSGFEPPFSSLSTVTLVANGLHFSLLPEGGWAGNIADVFVYAADLAGAVGALP